jgi:hypothetical protein
MRQLLNATPIASQRHLNKNVIDILAAIVVSSVGPCVAAIMVSKTIAGLTPRSFLGNCLQAFIYMPQHD